MTDDPRYPIGPCPPFLPATPTLRGAVIADIAALPARMRAAVAGLTDAQLDTPYRDDGWTVRQVVHHVADSHVNAFTRTKLALTESNPIIKPYDEKKWATLADVQLPIEVSLGLIEALHRRWVAIFESLAPADFARSFVHPELEGPQTLDRQVQSYSWHGRHHVAHITELRRRRQW